MVTPNNWFSHCDNQFWVVLGTPIYGNLYMLWGYKQTTKDRRFLSQGSQSERAVDSSSDGEGAASHGEPRAWSEKRGGGSCVQSGAPKQ